MPQHLNQADGLLQANNSMPHPFLGAQRPIPHPFKEHGWAPQPHCTRCGQGRKSLVHAVVDVLAPPFVPK